MKYGGVVPELASRDHVLKLVPLLDELLNITAKDLKDIDLIAITNGPGLLGPLLTGASFSKSLAWTLKIPSIEIDHLEAHIFSPMISEKSLKPPFISLLVSGGHTILSSVNSSTNYDVLGKTLDDSAGEVFDKVARHLGLPYPGGPQISKASARTSSSSFKFPRPMINTNCYDFSFSGLKTHVTQSVNKNLLTEELISNIAFDFENAILDVLISKTLRAATDLNVDNIVISGGVSANKRLRERFENEKRKDIDLRTKEARIKGIENDSERSSDSDVDSDDDRFINDKDEEEDVTSEVSLGLQQCIAFYGENRTSRVL